MRKYLVPVTDLRIYVEGKIETPKANVALIERVEALVEVMENIGKDLHEIAQNTRRGEA